MLLKCICCNDLVRPVRFAIFWLLGLVACAHAATDRVKPDFAELAKHAAVALPPPPPWAPPPEAQLWSLDEVKAELARITDTPPRVNMLRPRVLRPDHRWLVDFKGWFRAVQKPLKLRFVDQVWDCDDYANCFVAFADLLGMKNGEARGALCVGWATVYYRRPFAGIRAGGAHAIVIVATAQGLYMLEPQDGTLVALRDFPNRDTIEEINF